MPDPTFETRLRARLRDVLDSQTGPHPVWTDSPVSRRTSDRRRRGSWPIRVLAVAAVLAIGGGALSLVGSGRPRIEDPSRTTKPTAPANGEAPVIPAVLRGQFVAQLAVLRTDVEEPIYFDYPFYFIDLEDVVLVHGPSLSDDPVEVRAEDGTAAAWAGRIVRFTPVSTGAATVVIQAPLPCGDGRYLVRYNVAERPSDPHPWALTFTEPQDQCADRLAILVGESGGPAPPSASPAPLAPSSSATSSSATTARAWTHQPTRLAAGQQYSSWSFSEPFRFRVPASFPVVSVWTWLGSGTLRFGNVWWRGEFFDDFALPIDLCDPGAGSLPDIPSNPQAFESWLRSNGRSIDETVRLEVDGRTVMRYDTSESSCRAANAFFGRSYLIPTGDDTILFNVYGDTETEYQVADEIVRSMVFD